MKSRWNVDTTNLYQLGGTFYGQYMGSVPAPYQQFNITVFGMLSLLSSTHLSSLTSLFSNHLLQTRSPFQLSTNKRVKETGLISPCSSPSSTVPPWANSTWPSISTSVISFATPVCYQAKEVKGKKQTRIGS